jgi:hypothetical protein
VNAKSNDALKRRFIKNITGINDKKGRNFATQ